jgi:hypothetical protein
MDAANARAMIGVWEQRSYCSISGMPPEVCDRFDRNTVSMFADLGVDLSDTAQATAAFAGAYITLAMLLPVSHMPLGTMQTAIGTVRGLADRTDGSAMADEFETWLKNQ